MKKKMKAKKLIGLLASTAALGAVGMIHSNYVKAENTSGQVEQAQQSKNVTVEFTIGKRNWKSYVSIDISLAGSVNEVRTKLKDLGIVCWPRLNSSSGKEVYVVNLSAQQQQSIKALDQAIAKGTLVPEKRAEATLKRKFTIVSVGFGHNGTKKTKTITLNVPQEIDRKSLNTEQFYDQLREYFNARFFFNDEYISSSCIKFEPDYKSSSSAIRVVLSDRASDFYDQIIGSDLDDQKVVGPQLKPTLPKLKISAKSTAIANGVKLNPEIGRQMLVLQASLNEITIKKQLADLQTILEIMQTEQQMADPQPSLEETPKVSLTEKRMLDIIADLQASLEETQKGSPIEKQIADLQAMLNGVPTEKQLSDLQTNLEMMKPRKQPLNFEPSLEETQKGSLTEEQILNLQTTLQGILTASQEAKEVHNSPANPVAKDPESTTEDLPSIEEQSLRREITPEKGKLVDVDSIVEKLTEIPLEAVYDVFKEFKPTDQATVAILTKLKERSEECWLKILHDIFNDDSREIQDRLNLFGELMSIYDDTLFPILVDLKSDIRSKIVNSLNMTSIDRLLFDSLKPSVAIDIFKELDPNIQSNVIATIEDKGYDKAYSTAFHVTNWIVKDDQEILAELNESQDLDHLANDIFTMMFIEFQNTENQENEENDEDHEESDRIISRIANLFIQMNDLDHLGKILNKCNKFNYPWIISKVLIKMEDRPKAVQILSKLDYQEYVISCMGGEDADQFSVEIGSDEAIEAEAEKLYTIANTSSEDAYNEFKKIKSTTEVKVKILQKLTDSNQFGYYLDSFFAILFGIITDDSNKEEASEIVNNLTNEFKNGGQVIEHLIEMQSWNNTTELQIKTLMFLTQMVTADQDAYEQIFNLIINEFDSHQSKAFPILVKMPSDIIVKILNHLTPDMAKSFLVNLKPSLAIDLFKKLDLDKQGMIITLLNASESNTDHAYATALAGANYILQGDDSILTELNGESAEEDHLANDIILMLIREVDKTEENEEIVSRIANLLAGMSDSDRIARILDNFVDGNEDVDVIVANVLTKMDDRAKAVEIITKMANPSYVIESMKKEFASESLIAIKDPAKIAEILNKFSKKQVRKILMIMNETIDLTDVLNQMESAQLAKVLNTIEDEKQVELIFSKLNQSKQSEVLTKLEDIDYNNLSEFFQGKIQKTSDDDSEQVDETAVVSEDEIMGQVNIRINTIVQKFSDYCLQLRSETNQEKYFNLYRLIDSILYNDLSDLDKYVTANKKFLTEPNSNKIGEQIKKLTNIIYTTDAIITGVLNFGAIESLTKLTENIAIINNNFRQLNQLLDSCKNEKLFVDEITSKLLEQYQNVKSSLRLLSIPRFIKAQLEQIKADVESYRPTDYLPDKIIVGKDKIDQLKQDFDSITNQSENDIDTKLFQQFVDEILDKISDICIEIDYGKVVGQGSSSIVYEVKGHSDLVAIVHYQEDGADKVKITKIDGDTLRALNSTKMVFMTNNNHVPGALNFDFAPIKTADGRVIAVQVMEKCRGNATNIFINNQSTRISKDQIVNLLQALVAFRKTCVAHRDIKPDNMLVTKDGQVCLADFGMATGFSTKMSELAGTLIFMAPEIIRYPNRMYSSRTDIYSLGISLTAMLLKDENYLAKALGLSDDYNEIKFRGNLDNKDIRDKAFDIIYGEDGLLAQAHVNSKLIALLKSMSDYYLSNRPTPEECLTVMEQVEQIYVGEQ